MTEHADVDGLRATVRHFALACDTPIDRHDAFERARAKIYAVVAETLQFVAADLNRPNALFTLPPEILCCIANYLPLADRVRVALVCRSWRSTILATPSLWTTLSITLGTRALIWSAALDVLFARSAKLPLTLDLRVEPWYDPTWEDDDNALPAIRRVAYIIKSNMFRTKSLSLQIPDTREIHDHWARVLATRAPMLEHLFIYATDDTPDVSSELLGGYAPVLKTLYIEFFALRDASRALRGLTTLHFDRFNDETLHIIASLPQLQRLIISSWEESPELVITCPQDFDIFLVGSEPTAVDKTVILQYFPHAKSVRYSLHHTEKQNAPAVLSRALDTDDTVTSLLVRWSEPLGIVQWEGSRGGDADLAIEVNSILVAVDVRPEWFLDYLNSGSSGLLQRWTSHIETATVPETAWLLMVSVNTPRLKEATVLLDEHEDYGQTSLFSAENRIITRQSVLTTLRFSCQPRTPDQRHRTVFISAVLLARHIRSVCGDKMLATLVLRDIVLGDPDSKELHSLVGVIRYEDSTYCADTEELKSWTWGHYHDYPSREAMAL